jgi:hypothetical protein
MFRVLNFRNQFVCMLLLLIASSAVQAQDRPNLAEMFPVDKLEHVLLPRADWHPWPTVADRFQWEALTQDIRSELLAEGEEALQGEWPPLPATLFMEYARNGNRSRYQNVRNQRRDRLQALVIAECIEAKGRFIDEILNGVWTTCEESFWGVPAHLSLQDDGRTPLPEIAEPVVDLFAAETANLLAWTLYLVGAEIDKETPLVRQRVQREMDRRILGPLLEREDWSWMGFSLREDGRRVNNWNPWINSNWLTAALLMEPDEDRRRALVHKSLRSLQYFYGPYPADGGCDEGPGYWGHAGGSLFDCLEILHSASNGAIEIYDASIIREIGRFIARAHINGPYCINFADAPARVSLYADLVYRYGRRIGDDNMMALGAWAAKERGNYGHGYNLSRQLAALFNAEELRNATGEPPLLRDVWLPDIQVMAARSKQGSVDGLYLAAKGGHNNESHNHNDIGNFIVYADGYPAIIDIGVEDYTAKTFSSQRYTIWTMQSAWHSLPTINGVMQKEGREYEARNVSYTADDKSAIFSLDIAGAWEPEAGLNTWQRTLKFNRDRDIELIDAYDLSKTVDELTLSLVTCCEVQEVQPGVLELSRPEFKKPVRLHFDAGQLHPTTEPVDVADRKLRSNWGLQLQRIIFTANKPTNRGQWTLRIDQP